MNIERALSIPGFMYEAELSWLAKAASQHFLIAEIGSWKGRSTAALSDNTEGVVVAIDTWEGTGFDYEELHGKERDWLFNEFQKNKAKNVMTLRRTSLDAVKYIVAGAYFDMIFIDATHTYKELSADIVAWRFLLAPDGLLCGHDYNPEWPGVVQAVDELVPNRKIEGSIWYAD